MKLTKEQIEFAKAMTIKQRHALHGLAMFDCYISASELGDQEMRDLVGTAWPNTTYSPVRAGACRGALPMPVE